MANIVLSHVVLVTLCRSGVVGMLRLSAPCWERCLSFLLVVIVVFAVIRFPDCAKKAIVYYSTIYYSYSLHHL